MSQEAVQALWYGRSTAAWWVSLLLSPFAALFAVLSYLRRMLFRLGVLRSVRVSQPVVVVGNITAGGTGKTPLVIWLTHALRQRGFTPGVIARGYGASTGTQPIRVESSSQAFQVGDEAVHIAQQTGAVVVVGHDRVLAAQRAIALGADVIISDDGLQHYRLVRDVEIAVVDGERRFGNGMRLPAGPLRESRRRLQTVDFVIRTLRTRAAESALPIGHAHEHAMRTHLANVRCLVTGDRKAIAEFEGRSVNAVAGIGHPAAFFSALSACGLKVTARPLNDHAHIRREDLLFENDAPVFMTEKDAVKCKDIADARCFAVQLQVDIERGEELVSEIVERLRTP